MTSLQRIRGQCQRSSMYRLPVLRHRTGLGKPDLVICKKAPAVTAIVTNTHKAGTLVALPKVCVGAYNEL